jgi:membrane-bound metal-dependent hydrolase YbcI (DUF457 family)
MMGRTHALTGTLGAVAVGVHAHLSIPEALAAVAITTGAALLPDIDHPRSTVSNAFGPITHAFSWFMRKISGGHRWGTHSAFGIAVLGGVAHAGTMYRNTALGQLALCVPMILALAGGIRLLRIPGWIDDLAPIPIVVGIVCLTDVPLGIVAPSLMLGCAIHVVGDWLTRTGVPVLWPLSTRRFKANLFSTNGLVERFMVTPLVLCGIAGEIIWGMFPGAF